MDETPSARTSSAGWLGAVLIVALCVIATTTASADDDLPTRVGRVSESAGPLYLAPEDRASDWATIGQNYPVTAGDNLRVAPEGRAEVDFGSGQLRLAGDTNIQITALDEHRFAFFVGSGRVILRLRTLDPGNSATIDTHHAQIQLDRPGSYRLDIAPESQQTILTVREGEADMRFGGGMQHVLPGQTATVAASDPGNVALRNGFGTDGFDAWSAARDRTYDASPSAAYVSREMVGASDLGYYGTWENYGTYGNVWFPTTVAVGWAPYRFGRWVWCGPWGWTWVDDAPWGFAPFHYGRWVSVSGRWGWCPGALVRRPVWSPALVGWFGGPGWGFSRTLGTPVFGWVPLSWGEPFWPHWRCSGDCWRRLNHPYAVTAAERRGSARVHFANGDVPGAITAVPGHILSGSKPVAVNLVHVSRTTLAGAPILTIAPSAPRPDRGGRMVSAPPVHDNAHNNARDKTHDSVSASFRQPAPRVYGGVSDGRGAYTGVAPTPGPRLPANGDRSHSPMIRPAAPPVARVVPAPVLAPAPAVAPVAPLIVPAQSAAAHSTSPARGQVPPTVNAVPGGAPPK